MKPTNCEQIHAFLIAAHNAKKLNSNVHVQCCYNRHNLKNISSDCFFIDMNPNYAPFFEPQRDFKLARFFDRADKNFSFIEFPVSKSTNRFSRWASFHGYCLPQDIIADDFAYPVVTTVGCSSAWMHKETIWCCYESYFSCFKGLVYTSVDSTDMFKKLVTESYHAEFIWVPFSGRCW